MKHLIYVVLLLSIVGCQEQKKNVPENFDYGSTESGHYTNNYFDLEVTFDSSWVVQSQEQVDQLWDAGSELITDENTKAVIKASEVNSANLLALFKYEVGTPVDFNPSFILVAENTKNSPGIKTGKDYLFHAKKLLQSSGMEYSFDEEMTSRTIDGQEFYTLRSSLDVMGFTMKQDYTTTVKNGFSLSFIITYVTDEQRAELNQVIDNMSI